MSYTSLKTIIWVTFCLFLFFPKRRDFVVKVFWREWRHFFFFHQFLFFCVCCVVRFFFFLFLQLGVVNILQTICLLAWHFIFACFFCSLCHDSGFNALCSPCCWLVASSIRIVFQVVREVSQIVSLFVCLSDEEFFASFFYAVVVAVLCSQFYFTALLEFFFSDFFSHSIRIVDKKIKRKANLYLLLLYQPTSQFSQSVSTYFRDMLVLFFYSG